MDKRTSNNKVKRKRDKDAEYEKKKRDRLNTLLNDLSALLQNRKVEFKSSFAKPTKEVVMNDARLYIMELQNQLRMLSPSIDDPLNRMPMSDDELIAGFNILQRSQYSLFARMAGKEDLTRATHSCNVLVELAAKSSLTYLGIHAVAVQIVFWGVVVFNPYATVERLANFMPFYEKHKHTVPKEHMYVMDIHLDVLFAISFSIALIALGYMDKGMKHWNDGLKLANDIGHANTVAFVWSAMSIIKYHCEEAFTREEVIELKNILTGRWKPYSTFLMAASITREAKTPDEESEGQQLLVQSVEEAIQVYGSMNDLSIRARSLPVWLKSDPTVGLKVVEGMINRAEKTGATSCMMVSDLYRYKGDMLLGCSRVESVAEIESLFRLAADLALQSGYSLSYLKCLRSMAKLQLAIKDPRVTETLNQLHSMYIVLKRSCLVNTPFVLQDVASFLKINGFVP